MKNFNVYSYRVYFSNHTKTYSGKSYELPAQIVCYNENRQRVLVLTFISSDSLPKDYQQSGSIGYRVFVPLSSYPWYLDLLRNESPIRFSIDEKTLKWDLKTLYREDVGDGDWD